MKTLTLTQQQLLAIKCALDAQIVTLRNNAMDNTNEPEVLAELKYHLDESIKLHDIINNEYLELFYGKGVV